MSSAYDFLNLYKQLEDLLEERAARRGQSRRGSVVMDFINSAEGTPYRERLDLCREIRNLMTHNADLNGEAVVTPSSAVMESLEEIVEAVRKPRPVSAFATPLERLMTAHAGDPVYPLMRRMEEKGFSHVPVVKSGRVQGVFSISTVFSAGLRADRFSLDETAVVRDFEPLLPIERHLCERFAFLRGDASVSEAALLFEQRDKTRSKRTAALFMTSDGTPDGQLEGMLTPWDLMSAGKKQPG